MITATNKIKPLQHYYKMHINLENVAQEKSLGVKLIQKTFRKTTCMAKTYSTRYFFQQNLSTCSRDVKLKSYKTEYKRLKVFNCSSVVFSPEWMTYISEKIFMCIKIWYFACFDVILKILNVLSYFWFWMYIYYKSGWMFHCNTSTFRKPKLPIPIRFITSPDK